MKRILYGLLLFSYPLISSCQSITINGKVIDENGKPVPNATITIKQSDKKTISDQYGIFTIHNSLLTDTLVISAVGYEITEQPNNERGLITVILRHSFKSLNEVIISTGYQDLPKERATGAFEFIDNKTLNRRISTTILDKLENTGAVYFDRRNGAENIGIRGRNTIFANASPLIVLDNFPYAGDISDINPNDIENVTILKDAAASSVWGAFSGNGVIIINTKKGKAGQPQLEFNANVTMGQKPDLFYDRNFLDAADYISMEQMLYAKGFYDNDINNTISYPILSPVVELLVKRTNNQVTDADLAAQINALSKLDLRRQLSDYLYRNSWNSQYHLNYSGSSGKYNYFLSAGYDKNWAYLMRNNNERISLRSANTFNLSSKWQFSISMVYIASNNSLNNSGTGLVAPSGKAVYPYEQLRDAQGNNLAIPKDYRLSYLDTAGNGKLLSWLYKPLDELAAANNRTALSHALVDVGITYKMNKNFNAQLKYRYEKQTGEGTNLYNHDTYIARNLINLFTQINGSQVKYQVPNDGILDRSVSALNAYFVRAQLNYNKSWNYLHEVVVLAGAELQQNHRTASSNRIYGYNDDLLTTGIVDYVDLLPTYDNIGSSRNIPNPVYLSDNLNRFISVFANGSYTYNSRYILSLSARKDASNIFGVNTNQKWVPLWSAGLAWQVDKESFFKNNWLSLLKGRITYGYSGNVDNSLSAYPTILYFSFPSLVNQQLYANINNPPNPELRWERT
ncbi:MAG TPA: carboxypeptidase-like regulatory domain-containing protein, partial [Chitinophagaceae bacterium]|nr:carboxypeptidase-like regulatory domain-containing protein [Chitinophagaceae bacterium]